MTHFHIGLYHNLKKKERKKRKEKKEKENTFIGNRSRDFQYNVGKKSPNRAN